MSSIPKLIHYCWYGNGEKPESFYKCLESWKKYLPDYEIIEWNESNSDIENSNEYVRDAFTAKKYAFVSDYFRLKALYEQGGLYFDTDYEVLKPLDELFKDGSLITGFESEKRVLTAFIAVEKKNPIIEKFLKHYETRKFINEDGSYDLTPNSEYFGELMTENGIDMSSNSYQETDSNVIVYPIEILCGFDMDNWHEKITKNTYGVHHMAFSWLTDEDKKHSKKIELVQKILGYRLYDFLKGNIYNRLKKRN